MRKIFFTLITLLCLTGCVEPTVENSKLNTDVEITRSLPAILEDKELIIPEINQENLPSTSPEIKENLEIHFIDVGQADCILVKSSNDAMLIDAGNNDDAEIIESYLKNQKIETLKYVIGTHPHEDHIGSLDTVINKFDVKNIIMPKKATTTKTFEDVVNAIENKKLSITAPKVGDKYTIGNGSFEIISPVASDYGDNLNNYSVGILLTYGDNKFIFTGDAEKIVEKDILATGINIDADLMKMAHHGSSTSNTEAFLDKISPNIAIITCGKDNSYGHPHKEIVECLNKRNINTYRTDLQGHIIALSDGKTIAIKTEKTNVVTTDDKNINNSKNKTDNMVNGINIEYIFNTNSKVFHYLDCDGVKQMSQKNKKQFIGIREDAIKMGYRACGICKP